MRILRVGALLPPVLYQKIVNKMNVLDSMSAFLFTTISNTDSEEARRYYFEYSFGVIDKFSVACSDYETAGFFSRLARNKLILDYTQASLAAARHFLFKEMTMANLSSAHISRIIALCALMACHPNYHEVIASRVCASGTFALPVLETRQSYRAFYRKPHHWVPWFHRRGPLGAA
jgi:hypothetical protein